MFEWKVKALDYSKLDTDDLEVEFDMCDSVLLECIAETFGEAMQYILDRSIAECKNRHLSFTGFELIAW